jgi:hypothetical protein
MPADVAEFLRGEIPATAHQEHPAAESGEAVGHSLGSVFSGASGSRAPSPAAARTMPAAERSAEPMATSPRKSLCQNSLSAIRAP